jgi:AcrR family transcriptional regulator
VATLSTRERILEIAETRFIKDGIEKTQMIEIAQDCEINRRTLYRYFATKDLLAFEVEMIVMERIQRYMNSLVSEQEQGTGAAHVRAYFARVKIDQIQNWLRYTAEFDRYFQNDYPDSGLSRAFIENIRPQNDPLFRFIEEGIADGSIRADATARELYHFISQSFLALFQRLILRRNHLADEHCADVNFEEMFKNVMLKAIGV